MPSNQSHPTPDHPLPDDALRASDQEREQVISLLSESTAAGRLDLGEFEERVSVAYSVRTRGELRRLLADLPGVLSPAPPAPEQRPRAERSQPSATDPGRTVERLAPYGSWLVTAVVCLTIWAASSVVAGTALYFWPFWVIVPWGVVLASGALRGTGHCGRARPHMR